MGSLKPLSNSPQTRAGCSNRLSRSEQPEKPVFPGKTAKYRLFPLCSDLLS